jgi:FKBP-type peptidyl-prolyl cis-trans isomerase
VRGTDGRGARPAGARGCSAAAAPRLRPGGLSAAPIGAARTLARMQFHRIAPGAIAFVLAAVLAPTPGAAQGGESSPPPLPDGATWTTTDSGLKYAVIKAGVGKPEAVPGDRVRAHYTGWLKDTGEKFDSSYDRNQPFQFLVGQGVIEGWSEVVQLMPTGAKFRVEIPPELGYGERGSGQKIPPNATLLFDIELMPGPPKFQPANVDEQVQVEDGLVYETVVEGEGEECSADDAFSMHYTLYTSDGQMLQSSLATGQPLEATTDNDGMPPVFQKMPLRMKRGQLVRVETSREQGLGERQPTDTVVWYLQLVDVFPKLPLPEFGAPADDELEASDSGLKWKVLKEGEGESPNASDVVTVHYAGKLLDGTVFDSSYGRGKPMTFPLNRVIPGWTEGVAMMKPGEARIFVIPPDLAYGDRSAGQIPPGSTLVFYVELIRVGR